MVRSTAVFRPFTSSILCALLLAACGGSNPDTFLCDPACPDGTRCTREGCVSDNPGGEDLAVTADMAAGCSPACGGATPHCNARGQCVPCVDDQHCPTGQICKTAGNSSICAPGCNDDSRCAGMGVSFKCCGGGCIDTSKDSGHCGGCGVVCGGQHATAKCTDGACMLGACSPGWGDCNMNAADGCEVNTASDPGNCTGCGMACNLANAIPDCAGKCRIRACRFGWDDCDGKEDNGCELKVLDNNANCGGCGLACPFVAHAKNACVNAACQLLSCDAGYSDCDGMMQNGCEVATGTDVNNCGMCGVKCAQGLVCRQGVCTCPQCNLPNARSTCVNFQCAVDQCNINWGDCDGLPQNGCELNLTSDAKNCGQCSKVCAQGLVCQNGSCTCPNCMLPNAKTACINNMCVLDSCFQGFGNCDGNNANGCEVDHGNNNLHCGACGKACPMGNTCVGGVCQAFRANVLVCGGTSRNPNTFIPQGMNFNVQLNNCNADINTQALFITRNWGNGISAQKLQDYLNNGGIVLTEYSITYTVWNAAFGTNLGNGSNKGNCQDTVPTMAQFNANDPFWQANGYQQNANNQIGCGYTVGHLTGITTLSGWDANSAAVGYRDLGNGRLWATDFDWQDGENFAYQYSAQLMGYMMTHRR